VAKLPYRVGFGSIRILDFGPLTPEKFRIWMASDPHHHGHEGIEIELTPCDGGGTAPSIHLDGFAVDSKELVAAAPLGDKQLGCLRCVEFIA
jgi:hypothetical protein